MTKIEVYKDTSDEGKVTYSTKFERSNIDTGEVYRANGITGMSYDELCSMNDAIEVVINNKEDK